MFNIDETWTRFHCWIFWKNVKLKRWKLKWKWKEYENEYENKDENENKNENKIKLKIKFKIKAQMKIRTLKKEAPIKLLSTKLRGGKIRIN